MLTYRPPFKMFRSETFNFDFNMVNGYTAMWGKTHEDDPEVAPFPIIADVEITEICKGPGGIICPFCYKSNTPNKGSVMSFDLAKELINKMPAGLTQIAFGVDAQCESNPEWFEIFQYSRSKGYIPNVTVADITEETAKKLASVCGAVACSVYHNKNWAYDSVDRLVRNGLKQVNLHYMISQETYDRAFEVLKDIKTDPRLKGLNAIVFLSLKQKGRGIHFNRVTDEQYKILVDRCLEAGISFGFDSCGAHKFLTAVKDRPNYEQLEQMCEKCESTVQSSYFNANGEFFPCSFTEGTDNWITGLNIKDFNSVGEIWEHPRTQAFRETLLKGNRNCPIYDV